MSASQKLEFNPGSIVKARGREWVVLPQSEASVLYLRPLGGGEESPTVLAPALERDSVQPATFPYPSPEHSGTQAAGLLLRDALMLKLRAGAGPFRSFGNIAIEPRAYQLVPLMMALKQQTIRLLIADDVGIGKTIEAGLIAREMMDRGEINRLTVLCPPHLCEQWQKELSNRFHIHPVVVRSSTAAKLERGLPAGTSIFSEYPFTVVSLDYIKSKNRRDAFAEQCPEFVIVDEAHTCSRTGQGRQQRYELLRDLANEADRHLVLLTATPHSGDEDAFYNLLSLLDKEFAQLKADTRTDHPLRKKLAEHFVQRRRQDIKEWQEGKLFPERLTAEVTYRLSGEWNAIFQEVVSYAQELVEREQEGTFKARMNWWAALALLRCISSSPQAAIRALNTRLDNVLGLNGDNANNTNADEADLLETLEAQGYASVLDGTEDNLTTGDIEPGVAQQGDIDRLQALVERTRTLTASGDPKLKTLIQNIGPMLDEGHNPVVFCRYIATAEYLAEALAKKFKDREVLYITGNLNPTERQERIEALKESEKPPLLIATDCLSEGINLQDQFTAVIHYDLTWNPTRHEQREGRVDRFGQQADKVKTLMLYGDDNPIDGAVLQVIIRKADNIRKALGVSVPAPENEERYMQAILNTVLLRKDGEFGSKGSLDLFSNEHLQALDAKWESAREKARLHRTIFAQNRLKPEEVMPEWQKAFAVLGEASDVERFVVTACERLEAPLNKNSKGFYRIPLQHLPLQLKERLDIAGLMHIKHVDFSYPTRGNAEFIHRTHPLVSHVADYLTELAMAGEATAKIARAGAIFSKEIESKTTIYLLRLRSRLSIKRTQAAEQITRELLAEEALAFAVDTNNQVQQLTKAELVSMMQIPPSKNMAPEARVRELNTAIENIKPLTKTFESLANERAQQVLTDHRRTREAADARGSYAVEPQLPVDVMGVYVLVPDMGLL
ncbi:helicase-related protein [Saccharophagus degradans]|uniref:Helicase-related protein n=1 Tax=Saccharophagus degradans TaxID=86304 RepID=A0AAW7X8D1_9GAMM|nr:helicase-related protein [Saccharophagus degradans]MDO6423061.1 helicase-related protein [Saccharophagus degradans]MDO6607415.1 helicase-related protein [Saccharophagus degradans]